MVSLLFFLRKAYLDKSITQREKVGSAIQKCDLSRIMNQPSNKWKSVSKRMIICVKPITMVKASDVGKVMSSRSNRHKEDLGKDNFIYLEEDTFAYMKTWGA